MVVVCVFPINLLLSYLMGQYQSALVEGQWFQHYVLKGFYESWHWEEVKGKGMRSSAFFPSSAGLAAESSLVVRVDFLLANFPDILGLGGLSVRCWGRVFGMRKWGRKFLVICGRLEKLFRLRILQTEPIFIFCICTLLSTADPALRMFVGCYHKSDAVRGEFPCDPIGLGVIWKGEEFCILLSWQIYWWIFLLCL